MRLITAKMLWNFDFELGRSDGRLDESQPGLHGVVQGTTDDQTDAVDEQCLSFGSSGHPVWWPSELRDFFFRPQSSRHCTLAESKLLLGRPWIYMRRESEALLNGALRRARSICGSAFEASPRFSYFRIARRSYAARIFLRGSSHGTAKGKTPANPVSSSILHSRRPSHHHLS